MATDGLLLRCNTAALRFDPRCGMIRGLSFADEGRRIAPLHRVPWAGEALPEGLPRHQGDMEGDFFCAPFAAGGGTAPVPHGWPANGDWQVTAFGATGLTAGLMQQVQGAALEKRLTLRDGHPFLYQTHRFSGGSGRLSAANHAMVSLPSGGLLSFSPKAGFRTPLRAPEPDAARGRSSLAYPAAARDPCRFPASGGGTADLTTFPWAPAHEDFVVAQEAQGTPLGWTAVVRPAEGDLVLSLRNPAQLPHTMLWHSHGGRDYAPWSGRHRACLGVEEGRAGHMTGGSEAFDLGPVLDIRHALGAIAWPGSRVVSVVAESAALTVTGEDGHRRTVPFELASIFPDRSPS